MSSKYKFVNDGGLHFVTLTVVYWIDLFTRKEYCKTIFDSLTFCEKNKGLKLYAYCIMPSHLHFIIGSNLEPQENIMRDFKRFASGSLKTEIKNHTGESRKEWMLALMNKAGKKSSHQR